MKTICQFIVLVGATAFTACQSDLDSFPADKRQTAREKIIIADGKIQDPQWLVHTIDSIAHLYEPAPGTNEFIYPWVYSVEHENQEYIYLLDALNSCATCGNLFFTLSGKPIQASPTDPESGLYNELAAKKDRTLIWRHK